MKIYVDELPKDIAQRRRCFDGYVLNCVELMFDSSYEPKQIALLSDYTKQVRKEVYDYILDRLGNIEIENNTDYNSFIAILDEILDQIQGE